MSSMRRPRKEYSVEELCDIRSYILFFPNGARKLDLARYLGYRGSSTNAEGKLTGLTFHLPIYEQDNGNIGILQ